MGGELFYPMSVLNASYISREIQFKEFTIKELGVGEWEAFASLRVSAYILPQFSDKGENQPIILSSSPPPLCPPLPLICFSAEANSHPVPLCSTAAGVDVIKLSIWFMATIALAC